MNNFNLLTKIHMGPFNAKDYLYGDDNVFIISDKFINDSGKLDFIIKQFNQNNIKYEIFSDIYPDPDIKLIQNGIKAIQKNDYNIIIAIGGGSAIDTAKAIMFFIKKIKKIDIRLFIAIPTTSGTGSEVTKFSVISDKENNIKYPIVDDSLCPNIAILDPLLTLTVPPVVVADTGIDVLTHAIESFVSIQSNIFTEALAQKAIQICMKNLVLAFKNDVYAKSQMLYASCLAGIAFNQTSLGLTHSFAHSIGAKYHIPHGRSNGIFLTRIISFNTNIKNDIDNKIIRRYSLIADFLNIGSYNYRQSVKNLISLIKDLMYQLNLPTSLKNSQINVEDYKNSIISMAKRIEDDICTKTNPKKATTNDIKDILLNMFHDSE